MQANLVQHILAGPMTQLIGPFQDIWQAYIYMYICILNLCFQSLLIPLISSGVFRARVCNVLDTCTEFVYFLQVLFGQGDAILPYAEEICSCLKSCVHLKCKSAALYAAKVGVMYMSHGV